MVTRLPRRIDITLFPKEHREAKGISASQMAAFLGIERESVYRLEREWRTRMTPEKQRQYAEALGIHPWELWHLPSAAPSLDAMMAGINDDATRNMIADIVRRLIADRTHPAN